MISKADYENSVLITFHSKDSQFIDKRGECVISICFSKAEE
jgi:hypothetical protein